MNFIVTSSFKNYPVDFVKNAADLAEQIKTIQNPILVVDDAIECHHPDLMQQLKCDIPTLTIHAIEENKTWVGVESVLHFLLAHQADKTTTIIAIGGGIVQEIATLAAHLFHRGLPIVFVPTTLLAMCDSAIGGKCSLNFCGHKNQLGAFHPPEQVIISESFLSSLSLSAIQSGMGEILKYALMDDSNFYKELTLLLATEGLRHSQLLKHIHRGLQIKKKYVEQDEFDVGVRHHLNFGHTFAHALELVTEYQMPHGLAVARGIDMANYLAWQLGKLDKAIYQEVHDLIQTYFACDTMASISAEKLIACMRQDKKRQDDKVKFILLEGLGKLVIEPLSLDSQFQQIIHSYLRNQVVVI